MAAFWEGSGAALLNTAEDDILGALARQQIWHFRTTEAAQSPAWRESLRALTVAIAALHQAGFISFVLLEYPMLRLGKRIDAVVLTDRAILVLEFKRVQADAEAMRQVEDYALDLFDFHEASRRHAVVPILVTDGGTPRIDMGLALAGMVSPVQVADPESLSSALLLIMQRIGKPSRALDFATWADAAYRPVPTIIEAARMLYARHGVEDIRAARAGARNLTDTTSAIIAAIAMAREDAAKLVLFVTGIPGAGKTLCGLNAVFADDAVRGTFLTGNPTLVHVLREALARDAIAHGSEAGLARRRMAGVIQPLPAFRNHYMAHPAECPAETVIVIDEAQRCWSGAHATRKTRDKAVPLTASEPACLLDIIGRHTGFAAIICLVGSGQEIHDGEGGLAEWGDALRARSAWRAMAPPDAIGVTDKRHCLGAVEGWAAEPMLHLDVPVRQVRSHGAAAWVDAVLRNDALAASEISERDGGIPFYITRDLAALRSGLRSLARGGRRAGLLASAGAKRLRAEGLGAELPHMEPAAVAHWFLDRFPPDVRASNALEEVATEFSCQGLELDYVGLCWDADLVRGGDDWRARQFVGTKWQIVRQAEAIANQVNTYRVLLTRARYDTLIFVPRGEAGDTTRDPGLYDGIAAFLRDCGVRDWQAHTLPLFKEPHMVSRELALL